MFINILLKTYFRVSSCLTKLSLSNAMLSVNFMAALKLCCMTEEKTLYRPSFSLI